MASDPKIDLMTFAGTMVAAAAKTLPPQQITPGQTISFKVEAFPGQTFEGKVAYVSPAVVEQYLDGRTIDDFRPRHLRVVRGRNSELDPEEQALLSLLRSWRIRRAREAA